MRYSYIRDDREDMHNENSMREKKAGSRSELMTNKTVPRQGSLWFYIFPLTKLVLRFTH
jgi:hypothetical protein